MTFSLFKILFSNMASFDEFLANFKKGPKGIAKNFLIFLLVIYCICVFGFLYIDTMDSIYNSLAVKNQTYVMPVFALVIGFFVTIFFGFLSVSTNYCTGAGEEQLLSLPLTPKQIFAAKFWISVLADSLFGVSLLAVASGIYGYREGLLQNPLFYVGFLISALALVVVAIVIIYTAFVLVLTIIPSLRKKEFLQGIASFFVIIIALGSGMIGGVTGGSTVDSEMLDLGQMLVNSSFGQIAKVPFMQLISSALSGKIVSILIMALICALIIFVFVPLLAPLYIKTLNGFTDVKTKKLNSEETEQMLKTGVKQTSILRALFYRDVKTVLREPAFFANGPLIIIIFPVIFIFVFAINFMKMGEGLGQLTASFKELINSEMFLTKGTYYVVLALSAVTVFMGNSTSIAASSFSREGKGFYDLKAMPIKNQTIVLAKTIHAYLYVVVSNLFIDIIAIVAFFALGLVEELSIFAPCFVKAFILSSLVSLVLIFAEMFIDTANPKLNWENPTAAFKQNVNSIISIFLTMTVTAVFAVCGIILLSANTIGYVILCAIFALIAAPLGTVYFKYASKRINTI